MKASSFAVAALVACLAMSLSAESYIGLAGGLTLPQGGSRMHRVGGAAIRGGTYLSDNWALECETAWLEDSVALGAGTLGHFSAWEWYDRMFGFSAFDPFVTVGAKGWIGRHGEGQVGPKAGVGAFYHLDDSWSILADAEMTLGLDTDVEAVYSLSLGVQYAF